MRAGLIKLALLAFMAGSCGGDEAAPQPAPSPIGTATPSPLPTTTTIELAQFGFAAIACDHDDPFDTVAKADYSDEVAGFSNLNQLCPTGDIAVDRDRLVAAAARYDPLLYVEGVFFDPATGQPRALDVANTLWSNLQQSIADSGVEPGRITFYLFDEPTLRNVALETLRPAADSIRARYPTSRIMLIEAFSSDRDPVVPAFIDLWGFNAYTIRDPAAEPLYTGYLDKAASQLRSGQALVLIGDGIHTPFHTNAGLSEQDMAEVAENYFDLAKAREDITVLLVYSWAGGIDNDNERGVRNLPPAVQDKWAEIGREILNR